MTKRIKLTEDDVYWSEEYRHLTILCEWDNYKQLKQQIIQNQKLFQLVEEWKDEIELDPSYENTTFTPLFDKLQSLIDKSKRNE